MASHKAGLGDFQPSNMTKNKDVNQVPFQTRRFKLLPSTKDGVKMLLQQMKVIRILSIIHTEQCFSFVTKAGDNLR